MVKKRFVDDGSIVIAPDQMERQFSAACDETFGHAGDAAKRSKITKSTLSKDKDGYQEMLAEKRRRQAGTVSALSQPSATEQGSSPAASSEAVLDDVPLLARRLGRAGQAPQQAATPTKVTPKAKAGKKTSAAKGEQGRREQEAALKEDVKVAIDLQEKVIACTQYEDFKLLENDLKTTSGKLNGKEELMIELEMDDALDEFRVTSKFLTAAKD